MFDKQAFLQAHAKEFQGYRLVTAADLRMGVKLLCVEVRSIGGEIFQEVQPAELRENFRTEGFLGAYGLQFVYMFLPKACPGGRYAPIHQDKVLATTIEDATENSRLLLTCYDFRGKIFLVCDET